MKKQTPETAIKNQIKSWLALNRWFHFHNLQGLGSYPGIPDIIAAKNGIVLFIEVKAPGGKLSDKQKEFQRQCIDQGLNYIVVRDYKDIDTKYLSELSR
jgi:hypothetical protein